MESFKEYIIQIIYPFNPYIPNFLYFHILFINSVSIVLSFKEDDDKLDKKPVGEDKLDKKPVGEDKLDKDTIAIAIVIAITTTYI